MYLNEQTKKKSSIKCVINHIEKKSICVSKLSARQRQKKKHTASIQDDFFFAHARMEICTEKRAHSSERDNSYALKRHSISYRRRDGYFSHPIKDSFFFHYSAFICSYTVHYISFYFYSLPIFETSTSSSVMYIFFCVSFYSWFNCTCSFLLHRLSVGRRRKKKM